MEQGAGSKKQGHGVGSRDRTAERGSGRRVLGAWFGAQARKGRSRIFRGCGGRSRSTRKRRKESS